jgi:hypothetical protein
MAKKDEFEEQDISNITAAQAFGVGLRSLIDRIVNQEKYDSSADDVIKIMKVLPEFDQIYKYMMGGRRDEDLADKATPELAQVTGLEDGI